MENTQAQNPNDQYENLQSIRASIAQKPQQRTKLWIIIGTVVVVLLVISAVVQIYTPKTVTVPETSFTTTNSNNTLPNLQNVTYTGPTPDFPTQFSIFSARTIVSQGQLVQELSAQYGLLKPFPEANFWVNGNLSLVFDPTTNSYTFTLKDLTNETLPIVDAARAEEVATSFLIQAFPDISLRPMMDQASYFVLGLEIEETSSPAQATAINIPYTAQLDTENFPVVYEKATQPLFVVTIDGNNTVRLVIFYPQFQQYTRIDTKAPISIDDALLQIQSGVASIISSTIVEANRVTMSELISATFTSVTVEYRLDPKSELLYPFYRFTGTATSANNITADVEVITPAIKTTTR